MNLLPASALIPTLNAAATLPATLAALRGSVGEIIISDGGSTDGTPDIAREHGALVIPAARGRPRPQLNLGCSRYMPTQSPGRAGRRPSQISSRAPQSRLRPAISASP